MSGQSHDVGRTQLGYLLRNDDLKETTDSKQFDQRSDLVKICSVRALIEEGKGTLTDLIRGEKSFGYELEVTNIIR